MFRNWFAALLFWSVATLVTIEAHHGKLGGNAHDIARFAIVAGAFVLAIFIRKADGKTDKHFPIGFMAGLFLSFAAFAAWHPSPGEIAALHAPIEACVSAFRAADRFAGDHTGGVTLAAAALWAAFRIFRRAKRAFA